MLDQDLQALQEVRDLLKKAKTAQDKLLHFNQHRIDKIVETMCQRGARYARELAEMAVEETKMGRVESKTVKNWFCSEYLWEYLKDLKTVGVIRRDPVKKIVEFAIPKGIVAGIIPTTNPTSTAFFKSIISLKSRNPIVISPHPRAVKCIKRSADIMHQAAVDAGAPEGCVSCLSMPTLGSTHELMKHKYTKIILATGGGGLVKAAYSSGKPALGVGPGNAPAYIHTSADVPHAVSAIVMSQAFDWGTVCATEQSIVADRIKYREVVRLLGRQKAYICNPEEIKLLEKGMVGDAGHGLNIEVIGRSPAHIARVCGFRIPEDSLTLVAPYEGIGKEYPLSMEKLSPVLALYESNGLEDGIDKCARLLHYGGEGHTLAIHAEDEEVILKIAEQLPAYRIVINSPTVQGAIGYATNLIPSMSLGCGSPGNNIISNNINALDLVDIKRIAWVKEGFVKPPVEESGSSLSSDGDRFPRFYSASLGSNTPAKPKFPKTPSPRVELPASPSRGSSENSQSPLGEKEIEEILKKAKRAPQKEGGY